MITVPKPDSILCKDIHTPAPEDYSEWASWISLMKLSRSVHQCPGCAQWVVWIPTKYVELQIQEALKRNGVS